LAANGFSQAINLAEPGGNIHMKTKFRPGSIINNFVRSWRLHPIIKALRSLLIITRAFIIIIAPHTSHTVSINYISRLYILVPRLDIAAQKEKYKSMILRDLTAQKL